MKRWWTTPRERAWARRTIRRVSPILTRAVVAGVVSLPVSTQASPDVTLPRTGPIPVFPVAPRTGGAAVTAWAFGTLSDAKQPNSQAACDLSHVCELAVSSNGGVGTGTGATIKNDLETPPQTDPVPNLPFTLTEEIDYGHPVTRGVPGNTGQGACYPATGVMTITDVSSTLVLDLVGQACQLGASPAQLIFTGSYVSDTTSTGLFANADGIGTLSINNPSGLEGTSNNMKASLLGQLKYTP